jgi:hypothetical protein
VVRADARARAARATTASPDANAPIDADLPDDPALALEALRARSRRTEAR